MASLRVSITEVRIRNYRSCKKTSFSLDPKVTALIGPNGAGKTNVLQALKLLNSRQRRPYDDVTEGASQRPCFIEVDFSVRNTILKYRGKFSIRPGENNTDVVVDRTDRWNFVGFGQVNRWVDAGQGASLAHYYAENSNRLLYSDGHSRALQAINKSRPALYLIENKLEENNTIDDPKIYSAFMAVKQFMTKISYYSASVSPTRQCARHLSK